MIKYIIIAGASRSGKTSLAISIKSLGFNHYKMDSIKRGIFGNLIPDSENFDEISYKMSKLIEKIIIDNESDTNGENELFVMDICELVPEDAKSLLKIPNVKVIFLGYTEIDYISKANEIQFYDKTKLSWTKNIPYDEILNLTRFHVAYSKYIKTECVKNNIPYYDTSYDREKVLNEILNQIKKEL